jgi:hypothetical protein
LPTLELRQEKGQLLGRWVADAAGFNVPVRMRVRGSEYKLVPLTTKFQPIELTGATKDNIDIDTFNYYIGVLVD